MSNYHYLPYVSYEIGVDPENPIPDYCPDTEVVVYDHTNTVHEGGIVPVCPLERVMVTAIFNRADYVTALNAAGYPGSPQPIPVGIQLCWSTTIPTGCENIQPGVVWYSPDTDDVYVMGLFRVPTDWVGTTKYVSLAVSFLHGNQTDTYIIPFQFSVGNDNIDFFTGDEVFSGHVWKKDNQIITEICERTGIIELHATHDREGWKPLALLHTGGVFGSEFDPYDSENFDPAFPPNQGALQQLPVLSVESEGAQTEIVKIDTSKLSGGECVIVVLKDGTEVDHDCGLAPPDITLDVTWAEVGGGYKAYVTWDISPPLPSGIYLGWSMFVIGAGSNPPTVEMFGGVELNSGTFEFEPVLGVSLPFSFQIALNIYAAGDEGTCYWFYQTDYNIVRMIPQTLEDIEMDQI